MQSYEEFAFINEYYEHQSCFTDVRLDEGFIDSVKNLYTKIKNLVGSVDQNDELFKEYKKYTTDNIIKLINKSPVPINKALKQYKDMRDVLIKNKDKIHIKFDGTGDSYTFEYDDELKDAVETINEYIKATVEAVPDKKLQAFVDSVIKNLGSVNKGMVAKKIVNNLSDDEKAQLKKAMQKEQNSEEFKQVEKELEASTKELEQEKKQEIQQADAKLYKSLPTIPQDLFKEVVSKKSKTPTLKYTYEPKKWGTSSDILKQAEKKQARIDELLKECKLNGSGIDKKFDMSKDGYNELVTSLKMYYEFQTSVNGGVKELGDYNKNENVNFYNKLAFSYICTMCKSENGKVDSSFGITQDIIDTYMNASGSDTNPAMLQLFQYPASYYKPMLEEIKNGDKSKANIDNLKLIADNLQKFEKVQTAIANKRKAASKDDIS